MEDRTSDYFRRNSKDMWARAAKKTALQDTVSLRKKQKPNAATELQRHLLSIQNGHRLTKVRRNGKIFVRFFRADDTLLKFGYSDSKKTFKSRRSLKDHSTVHMSDVKEIREGATSDVFKKVLQKLNVLEDQCMTIVIGGKFDTLDLIAPSKEIRDNWVIGLKQIKRVLGEADLATQEEIQMHQLFQSADKNGDSILTLKEVVMLFRQMNLNSDLEHARRVFEESEAKVTNKKGHACLNYKQFVSLYRRMTQMEELKQLFEKCARGGQYMDVNDVQDFFRNEQYEDKSRSECVVLIKENESAKNVAALENLSLTGFLAMFKMPAFDVFNERHTHVYQDMTKPMSYYFINSSHNTYLAADQLLGNSSVEMYIRALKRGCRCVEIDCWNGDEGEPIVYHGHTLTSKILFRDVIAAINTYAFEASAYPVIVSLENHCNIEQQKVMASIMKQTFGEKIYDDQVNENMELLPSPESLRDRIIIKNKKLSKAEVEAENAGDLSSDDEDDDDIGSEVGNVPEELARERKKKVSHDKKKKLAVELSNLINICQSAGFKSFEYAQEKQKCYHISSIAEKKAIELSEDHGADLVKHNIRQMTRIYPAGTRTDSSNYDPMQLWIAGCQVVALNYQTADDPMIINGGLFLDNGNSGYVLKPSFMLDAQNPFDARSGSFPAEWKKTLTLHVISGYQLPLKKNDTKDIIDPAVEVEIVGVPSDRASKSTRFIENNGFHPVWDETLTFEVAVPNLAIVYFKVMDHETHGKDVVVAVFAAPFHSLRQGYRAVHLRSKHGEEIWGSYLFVHIRIE